MDLASEKLQLIEQLVQVDDRHLLEEIKQLLKREVAGYRPDGTPITSKDIVTRAEESDKAIEKGDVISLEDIEEEAKSW